MKNLDDLLRLNKAIRVIGIDDAPFSKKNDKETNIVCTICSNTRIEGLLWGSVTTDGNDSTDIIISMLKKSKFLKQLHLIIIDGIAVGGFNVIDLKKLNQEFNLPCVSIMRRYPNLTKFYNALDQLPDSKEKREIIFSAGEIFEQNGFVFQFVGKEKPESVALILERITDKGKVPEALRLSHLIGSAIKTGESSKRA